MMNKLRTLKDLTYTEDNILIVCPDRLKEAAIKWIKELESYGTAECGDGCCHKGDGSLFKCEYDWNTDNVVEWIKYFFNITEEDLKNIKKVAPSEQYKLEKEFKKKIQNGGKKDGIRKVKRI